MLPNKQIPFKSIYPLSQNEQEALKEHIREGLEDSTLTPSRSPAGAPIFFVKKKNGSLRPVVDYRALNEVTTHNSHALPLIENLLNQLGEARVLSKVDLHSAFNLIRVSPESQYLKAFRCK
jgi:Reverse transcriptase (RNA-dependent DNA polymerase)